MRLDVLLVQSGRVRSRDRARELIRAGHVRVAGEVVTKAAARCAPDVEVCVEDPLAGYVGRAAGKLTGALDIVSNFPIAQRRILDAGASTGGFTQVLLERGAARVYAVDVGHGQLVDALRGDPRVVDLSGSDVRKLTVVELGGAVDTVVGDLSFISLKLVLPAVHRVLIQDGRALLLVKPQFEAGRAALDSRGVVRDPRARALAVVGVAEAAVALGLQCLQVVPSQVIGSAGNQECFLLLTKNPDRSVGLTMSEVRDALQS